MSIDKLSGTVMMRFISLLSVETSPFSFSDVIITVASINLMLKK